MVAQEHRTPEARTSRADVTVHILDINDHWPMFEEDIYTASIPENSAKGTTVIQITVSQIPDTKVPGANMGPIWGQQDPGGPHELGYLGYISMAPHKAVVKPVYQDWSHSSLAKSQQ